MRNQEWLSKRQRGFVIVNIGPFGLGTPVFSYLDVGTITGPRNVTSMHRIHESLSWIPRFSKTGVAVITDAPQVIATGRPVGAPTFGTVLADDMSRPPVVGQASPARFGRRVEHPALKWCARLRNLDQTKLIEGTAVERLRIGEHVRFGTPLRFPHDRLHQLLPRFYLDRKLLDSRLGPHDSVLTHHGVLRIAEFHADRTNSRRSPRSETVVCPQHWVDWRTDTESRVPTSDHQARSISNDLT